MNIKLPDIKYQGEKSLEECIFLRKSVRIFEDKDIELEKISQILWAAQGRRNGKRTVPSAGATYPLEIYITIKGQGCFHYQINSHSLEKIKDLDLGNELAQAAYNQNFISTSPVNIIICANFERTTTRYGKRGERYVYIEAGHCAQNIHLQNVALGLDSVPIGAFKDIEVSSVLNLSNNLKPLYIIPIGYEAK